MTLKEFFRKARRGRVWSLWDNGAIRCAQGYCPLGAVASPDPFWGRLQTPPTTARIVLKLKLPKGAARKIANAADKCRSRNRPWLLKHLGVRDRKPNP